MSSTDDDSNWRHEHAAKVVTPLEDILAAVRRPTAREVRNASVEAKFDPHTPGDVAREHGNGAGLTLSHDEVRKRMVNIDAALESIQDDTWRSPDNLDRLVYAFLDADEVMRHFRTQINGMVIRLVKMEAAVADKKKLEDKVVELRTGAQNLLKERDEARSAVHAMNLTAAERVAKIQDLTSDRDAAISEATAARARVLELERENDNYVHTIEKIEEYDPGWMKKVFGKVEVIRGPNDDGLDLLFDLPGLVPGE